MSKRKIRKILIFIFMLLVLGAIIYKSKNIETNNIFHNNIEDGQEYKNEIYIALNNNIPNFCEDDYNKDFETYSQLDVLGRCGVAYANICRKTMPGDNDKRDSISSVQPSGWKQKKYNGKYLYNRCHLIGYQLSNEDANKKNLITGTRYFNVEGMLPFENEVADYIRTQNNNENRHVLYRVTPDFKNNNLVASGVQIEAYSVEDRGAGVCFNVYIYNVQPGVKIDYTTGESILP